MENNEEWISASEFAKRKKVSTQTIYNRVRAGVYESREFKRGVYKGIIIKWDGSEEIA